MIKDWKNTEDGREKYQIYLASREWGLLKKSVHLRSGGVCEHCLISRADEVHHQTYIRKYKERLSDLLHVCRPCHKFLGGYSDVNPARNRPLIAGGSTVKSIYLAGKMTNWRDEICNGWSTFKQNVNDHLEYTWDQHIEFEARGRKLLVTGPYISPLIINGTDRHGCSVDTENNHMSTGQHGCEWCENIRSLITDAIRESDLVFAWIDAKDCYGTLIEIGYANAIGKKVAVFKSSNLTGDDFWLARYFSDFTNWESFDSSSSAWKYFLETYVK